MRQVSLIFDDGSMHNRMTDLAIQRVQHLVGMKGARAPSDVHPPSVLTRMGSFGLGTAWGRNRAAFMRHVGIDLEAETQHVPAWCREGRVDTPVAVPHATSKQVVAPQM